jgi:hypothetical protein
MLDVVNLLAMVKRDLNLRIVLQVNGKSSETGSDFLTVTLRCEPREGTGNPWAVYHALDITQDWYPASGRAFPAFVWHALFALYSTDFPSDWPTLKAVGLEL